LKDQSYYLFHEPNVLPTFATTEHLQQGE